MCKINLVMLQCVFFSISVACKGEVHCFGEYFGSASIEVNTDYNSMTGHTNIGYAPRSFGLLNRPLVKYCLFVTDLWLKFT